MDRMFATKSKVSKVKFCRSEPLEESDRISSLPDAAIHNIFSFLFSNDVVKTSMLAKRWRYLWASAPDIFLDDEAIPTSDRESGFVRFVDGLHRHHKAPEIKRYYLRLQQPNNSTFAESWVQFALARCVKRLFVNVVSHVPFRMPSCNSVRRMKLKLRGGDLVLPAAGGFTMLKYLALSEFRLAGNSVLDVNSDYCPLLRSFSLKNCSGLIGLRVDCPDLEDLCIRQCLDLDHLIVSGANIQTLSVEKSFTDRRPTSLVKITAPNLQTFTWLDRIIDNFSAGEFRSLRVAHVYLEIYYYEDTNNAQRFFQYLASAENLQLQMRCFWVCLKSYSVLPCFSS
ncbi:hypothetical protein C4D60_Mb09t26250 [Musa balbisiana]|uniref:F-box domain-containing protein n=1 Tax=Musa balbisiana TaxID=52838 RepID=A0A4S8IJZ6_MUSBA|nr:hypothetical protein C4D60_Mb09t26250 [Musa balbisiana]